MKKSLSIAVTLLFLMAPFSAGHSQTYKWVDDNGVVHLSDRPPSDSRYLEQKEPEVKKKSAGKNTLLDATRVIPVRGKISPGLKRFDEEMLKIMEETGYRAATLAITYNGKFVLIRGYGWQDKEMTKPINPYTRMKIASIDKCFGNAAAKTLIREGKLDKETQVFKYLSVEPFNGKVADPDIYEITLHNVMKHRLGWDKKHDGFSGKIKKAVKRTFKTNSPTMAQYNSFMATQPLQYRPGEKKVYSNYGSVLLRRVVEKAAGMPYLDYLKTLVNPTGATIAQSLPAGSRGEQEIWYKPERKPYFDAFTISAPDLCRFFQRYWISGSPRKKNGYIFSYHGSLPGTTSVVRQRKDGVNYAVLFNERGKLGNGKIDKRINALVNQVSNWSTILIEDNYDYPLD